MAEDTNVKVLTQAGLPTATNNNIYSSLRGTKYGEAVTASIYGSKMIGVADEGSYFTAVNPTPGTAIAGIAAADGLDDLEALIYLRMPLASTKRLYLDYILLQVAAAGANGTNFAFAMKGDKGNARFSSGGSSITPKNVNMASASTSEVERLQFGAVVPTAATSEARLLHHGLLRTVIKVIGDKYLFTFGNSSPAPLSGIPLEGTTQASINVPCPPVILGAGDTFLFHEFAASQSGAAQYQFSIGWHER